ncbi:hypothetical protein A3I27_01285 [Candidatus Giovannonibacteria bacterium RIFCSPLOWO2_02_FULL_43_11b]|uniref:Dipeptidylpeptidase IV N-terminal domain-containing protein n=1 Tax=Candidatus Giovannonibacteria bacterium RIFCSPHIGHO2_12_FULL_43_15 TaxID=1798341 RepID=A0A1F5WP85_9BACT|nr:MAG: hypothetical protein A2739_02830 [Candidatus Giovannonibacteria bacterium RIFCSPHIGHO2_01_FULL_43_100]OGF66673.1 MAG: hypothetical protein A3B97_02025 [Candidatus Giovannonibacteria bacterium RIFCSPHIGHO2_02_FULL_43_32]OGF77450.1 MAG: hypothetical protein A3F23_00520 [Candidatus Giovannonibacteria bacterium RIFCSPHIGHO2_12_FULL_43_15]OGF78385.1 MAG: hypothetical protein A3A15_02470 [Candidatus Giovannonibacteria bacterium RIFCSPLOWO2_01_FULL_43_60]OGF90246.1 MAG: hypothetical protein A3
MAFTPNGKSFAYVVTENGKSLVIRDGQKGKTYDDVSGFSFEPFSSDGKNFAYVALERGRGVFLILNGEERGPYDGITGFAFSPDGQHLAYGVLEKDKKFLVVDGTKKYDESGSIVGITWSPNGTQLAYVSNGEYGKRRVVVDGQRGKEYYDILSNITFSPDGKSFAYWAWSKSGSAPLKKLLVVDGVEYSGSHPLYGNLLFIPRGGGFLAISPDGKQLGYVGQDPSDKLGVSSAVVNGTPHKAYRWVSNLVFGPTGEFAFVASEGREDGDQVMLVVNDRERKKYDGIWQPTFSPDGGSISYGARIGKELWWIVEAVE